MEDAFCLLAVLFAIPVLWGPWAVRPARADAMMTGLPELTQEELQWQNKHRKRVKKVKLNKIALERINQKRKQNGRWALTEEDVEVAPEGAEIEAAPGATADTSDGVIPAADMPGTVDNSLLKYFPPIRSQGSLPTCGSFNGTYYAMTHMWALANDLDAKNGGDDFRLSPKWNNNMLNGGTNSGTWYYWCYDIGIKHGTATWAEFPYDSDYREWCLVPSTWYDAIYRRLVSGPRPLGNGKIPLHAQDGGRVYAGARQAQPAAGDPGIVGYEQDRTVEHLVSPDDRL
jgi:hypothetical protein